MKRIVLVGGGHVHLFFIKRIINNPLDALEVILISPSLYQYYSGMFSGYSEGLYQVDDIRINLLELSRKANIQFIEDAVIKVHPNENCVTTKSGKTVYYDVESFDIGSETLGADQPNIMSFAKFIKPNDRFIQTIDDVRSASKPVIVGGGAAGSEISLSIDAWRKNRGIESPLTLITASSLLESESRKASIKLVDQFKTTDIRLLTNSKVESIDNHVIHLNGNEKVEYDKIIWLTGPKASNLFKESHLQTNDKGFLVVNNSLQSIDYANIFGAGDCVTLLGFPSLPKNGVYAIRQAPILYENMLRYLKGQTVRDFKPQKNFLSILSLGNKRALLLYGRKVLLGKFPWRLKNYR
jgi:NADH dehydrogenase FAD-containing subunit